MLFSYQERNRSFEKLIVHMSSFHVISCLLRRTDSHFKDLGKTGLLVKAGAGNEGMISPAIRGEHVKQDIRYYNILYEAFTRSKINVHENPTREKIRCI